MAARVAWKAGGTWRHLQRSSHQSYGLFMVALRMQQQTQEVQCVWMMRIDSQNAAIAAGGFLDVARLMGPHCGLEQRR
ncbi:hypothetical protein HQ394_10005 [Defluviicoccus vanus]|uniref:Uncharacterized protein n=1 Tax=Defluviicoccus vanus TaxID=111831 RepID=A0A7H1MX55_9PROT|nr:hypothetical protein HQ394_10005 [Defluviicoccus vanus]